MARYKTVFTSDNAFSVDYNIDEFGSTLVSVYDLKTIVGTLMNQHKDPKSILDELIEILNLLEPEE